MSSSTLFFALSSALVPVLSAALSSRYQLYLSQLISASFETIPYFGLSLWLLLSTFR
jgi:hypothetical protein